MKKKCLDQEKCPLSRAYGAIGDWWSLLIVTRVVLMGLRRFNEIQADLGMAKNILTARLKKLVAQGVLVRVPAADGSAFHEYAATDKGKALFTLLTALRQWGETYCSDQETRRYALVDKRSGQPIPTLQVRSADGRVLEPDDLRTILSDAEAPPCRSASLVD